MSFDGKVVLITGASRGIGRAAAVMFAEKGARVAVHYNQNRAAAEETLKQMRGSGHQIFQADVADPEAIRTLVEGIVREMGGLNVLVNNAGIYEYHPIAQISYETWQAQWKATLETNLFSAANLCYCAAQHMIGHGGGHIVNVSSRGAFRGEPNAPAYGASKAGMNSMGQSLAVALAPHNISVTTVAPGWVETDMAKDYLAGPMGDSIRAQSPTGRVAKPEEVAAAIVFLASEETAFMTGAIVDVNGASYLRS